MISGVQTTGVVTPPVTKRQEKAPESARSSVVEPSSSPSFTSSRIRVDNLLDVAILEVRSGETGDIIRQYPTEQQIVAFQRASEALAISEQRHSAEATERSSEVSSYSQGQEAPVSSGVASGSVNASAPASTPSVNAADSVPTPPPASISTPYASTSAPSVSTQPVPTQSILV